MKNLGPAIPTGKLYREPGMSVTAILPLIGSPEINFAMGSYSDSASFIETFAEKDSLITSRGLKSQTGLSRKNWPMPPALKVFWSKMGLQI